MLPISVCLIAKNEEHNVDACLTPLKKHGFEIVVADTGSDDRTKELVRNYTDKLYDFVWCNDFSAARNYSVSKASNDWVLVVDFDEYLTDADIDTVLAFIRTKSREIGMITRQNPCRLLSGQMSVYTEFGARFFHRKYNHFEGIIHEQVFPLDNSEPVYMPVPFTVYHHGYEDEETLQQKAERNVSLLLEALQDSPEDAYLLFQTGKCYQVLHEFEQACFYYGKALEIDVDPTLTYVQDMIEGYGYSLLELKQYETSLGLSGVYDTFSHRPEFVFLMGLIYMNNALFEQAVQEFCKVPAMPDCSTKDLPAMALYNAGVIYECTNNVQIAIDYYKKCGDFAPALARLDALQTK